jgi:hypothetical protein
MKMTLLRGLLMLDAAILFLLGALLLLAPHLIEQAFGFSALPAAVSYLIGLWGCLFATTAIGYVMAAADPLRHLIWIQIGIARGALECIVGIVYLARGTVTPRQAGIGIAAAAAISLAYVVLYPRKPRLIEGGIDGGRPATASPA